MLERKRRLLHQQLRNPRLYVLRQLVQSTEEMGECINMVRAYELKWCPESGLGGVR